MAKYDRQFLVPYLQDVCALHMADKLLQEKVFQKQIEISNLQRGQEIKPPKEPELEKPWNSFNLIVGGMAGMLLLSPLVLVGTLLDPSTTATQRKLAVVLTIMIVLMGFFLWRISAGQAIGAAKKNKAKEKEFRKNLYSYYEAKKEMEDERKAAGKEISQLEQRIGALEDERKKLAILLQEAYGANVLPNGYRDIYAAVYLYDFFSSSRSDDLDLALSAYGREQVKDRLNAMISNQAEAILKERVLLAKQQRTLEQQHDIMMRKRACQIAATPEEQNQYLSMAECNAAATAYFAAANDL